MDYMTTKETAAKWKVSNRRILQYCNAGRIIGAEKMGNTWLIPKSAKQPVCDLLEYLSQRAVISEVFCDGVG